MKSKEIRGMDKNACQEKLLELKKELVKMNAQVAIGSAIKNPGQIRIIKKTIAKIYTIQTEQENAASKEAQEKKSADKIAKEPKTSTKKGVD